MKKIVHPASRKPEKAAWKKRESWWTENLKGQSRKNLGIKAYDFVPSSYHLSISRTLPDQHTPRAPNVGITVKTVYKIQTDTFPRRYRGEGILLTKVISIFSACSLMMSGVFTSPAEQKPPIIAPNSPVKSPSFSRFPYGIFNKIPKEVYGVHLPQQSFINLK